MKPIGQRRKKKLSVLALRGQFLMSRRIGWNSTVEAEGINTAATMVFFREKMVLVYHCLVARELDRELDCLYSPCPKS